MKNMPKYHPIQPLEKDSHGTLRFKENKIVSHILDWCASKNGHVGYTMDTRGPAPDLNSLSAMDFSKEDWQQLAQLTGYSLDGYASLSYVDDEAVQCAKAVNNGIPLHAAKFAFMERELKAIKSALRKPMARLFQVHPDDLHP